MFGAVLAIAVVVVVAFLLTDGGRVVCVEGELQDNARRADGSFLPRVETFAARGEAESFICRRIPYPRSTGDLMLQTVRVAREQNLGSTIEGEGGASIELEYANSVGGPARLVLQVTFPPLDIPRADGQTARIQGQQALVLDDEIAATVYWNRSGLSFVALGRFAGDFDRDALLAAANSVR